MSDTNACPTPCLPILIAQNTERKPKFIRKQDELPSDLRKIPKKQKKGVKKPYSCHKGKIRGENHFAFSEERKKRWKEAMDDAIRRRDVFYMVDGNKIIEKTVNAINTNSGVLTEDQLKHLQ